MIVLVRHAMPTIDPAVPPERWALTARVGLPDPGAFWSELRFPDALLIDLDSAKVSRL